MKELLLSGFCCTLLLSGACAQQKVSGTVTGLSAGEALPGVNVIVKGESTGTITDVGGNYFA